MKFVFYWFLFQLVLVSAISNMHSAHAYATGEPFKCDGVNGFVGFVSGALVPLADTPLINGDWCWNVKN